MTVPFEENAIAPPDDGVAVAVYPAPDVAHERGLVVLAMGLPYWVRETVEGYALVIGASRVGEVREQLELFERESVGWPPRPSEDAARVSGALVTPCFWSLVVAWVYWRQRQSPGVLEDVFSLDPIALFSRGEWWRPLTALFLHVDAGHLASNLGFGVPIFASVLHTFGLLRGWAALVLAAVAGNVLSAALQAEGGYRAIGASTAVFAGLGLLTGQAVRSALAGERGGRVGKRLFVPLAAGLILLGWLGAGGWRTDVIGHAMGFLAGLAGGIVTARAGARRE